MHCERYGQVFNCSMITFFLLFDLYLAFRFLLSLSTFLVVGLCTFCTGSSLIIYFWNSALLRVCLKLIPGRARTVFQVSWRKFYDFVYVSLFGLYFYPVSGYRICDIFFTMKSLFSSLPLKQMRSPANTEISDPSCCLISSASWN